MVSAGSGSIERWSLRLRLAMTVPSGSVWGVICVTVPTRVPPSRTSLPLTSPAALGTRTLRS